MTAGIDPKLYQLMAEQVQDYAIFLLDVNGRVASWNAGARTIKQYDAHEVIGRHFKQPKEGLGFDGSPVAHMWRSAANPDSPL